MARAELSAFCGVGSSRREKRIGATDLGGCEMSAFDTLDCLWAKVPNAEREKAANTIAPRKGIDIDVTCTARKLLSCVSEARQLFGHSDAEPVC